MRLLALLYNNKEKVEKLGQNTEITRVYFDTLEEKHSYRDYIGIEDIYESHIQTNKLLKKALTDNKKPFNRVSDAICSLVYIELFFNLWRSMYISKIISNIIEKYKPDRIYISERLPVYFHHIITNRFKGRVDGGRRYRPMRWFVYGCLSALYISIKLLLGKMTRFTSRRGIVSRAPLFIVQFGRTDIDALLPVMRYFRDIGYDYNVISTSEKAIERLDEEGFRTLYKDFLHSSYDILFTLLTYISIWFRFIPYIRKNFKRAGIEHTLTKYLIYNKSIKPGSIFQLILTLKTYERIFRRKKPSVVVVADDLHSNGRSACIIARRCGVPSFCLQNGPISVDDFGFRPIFADRFIAWGEETRRWLISHGEDESRVIVCGSPRYDALKQIIDSSQEGGEKCILYANSMFEDREVSERLEGIIYLSKRIKHRLIIAPHPSMPPEYFIHKVTNKGVEYQVLKGGLMNAIRKAVVVIIGNSGAGIEAIISGKDLIVYNPGRIDSFIPYSRYGAAVEVYDTTELVKATEEILNGNIKLEEGRARFIDDYLMGLEGRSVERIVRIIEGI